MFKMVKGKVKEVKGELVYCFFNYFVCNLPFWPMRRFFYIIAGMKIGKGSRILRKTIIVSPSHIVIGDRTYVNERCFLDGRSEITIGSDVTIAVYSKLISSGHDIDDEQFEYQGNRIVIEDNVVIFADSTVLAGAFIHRGCVIAAKSLVPRGEYKELSMYAGVPATFVRERISKAIYRQDTWHPLFR